MPENDVTDADLGLDEMTDFDSLLGPGNSDEILLAVVTAAVNEEEEFGRETVLGILRALNGEPLIDTAKAILLEEPLGELDVASDDPDVDELMSLIED